MSHKDNQDLRVREGGGWFWGEHELFTVFAPIIGPVGVSVYMAMARMIPLAAIDSDRKVRVRSISEWSSVGRSKCAEEMRKIIDLGMVLETKYLDGRDPAYKLASLKDLAKLGQVELLRRIGVRNTDTAPFDQSVKNKRERSIRLAKLAETEAAQAQVRELPLLDGESSGVRNTDTTEDAADGTGGVRNTDTVSAKSHPVSAKAALVSAESHSVSAGADTFKEREKIEEIKNPLPPAAQGEVGGTDHEEQDDPDQARPVLPHTHCTVADKGFATSLPIAARWVMAELGITKRRIEPIITAQLSNFCRRNRSATLEDACALMAKQGRLLHEHADRLRHRPWGWEKFIGEGHWTRPLPYAPGAQPATQTSTEATIGMRGDEAGDDPNDWAKYRAFILENADALEVASCTDVAVRLREIAGGLSDFAEADQELSAIEIEVSDRLHAQMNAADREALRIEVAKTLVNERNRMTAAIYRDVEKKYVLKRVFQIHKLPRLSFFYMPRT